MIEIDSRPSTRCRLIKSRKANRDIQEQNIFIEIAYICMGNDGARN